MSEPLTEYYVSFTGIWVEAENEKEAIEKAKDDLNEIEITSEGYCGPGVRVNKA